MTVELKTIFTIGVYGSTEDSFFGALVQNEIELFIDIRARRGLRGSKYSYANSAALQAKLKDLGIYYAHLKALAPTREIRAEQRSADKEARTAKRARTQLSKAYIQAYRRDILKVHKRKAENRLYANDMLSAAKSLADFPIDRPLRSVALFCVEGDPSACHRSLAADEFSKQLDVGVVHLDSLQRPM